MSKKSHEKKENTARRVFLLLLLFSEQLKKETGIPAEKN